jgi:hypothetical protein
VKEQILTIFLTARLTPKASLNVQDKIQINEKIENEKIENEKDINIILYYYISNIIK